MALTTMRQLLDHAAENDYGIPAFNVNNMEQMLAIMKAADRTGSPVIMQASRGARKFANDIVLRHLITAAVEMYPHIPVCMHQDHGNSVQTCLSAVINGFSAVMIDGSLTEDGSTPADYDYNVEVTSKVTEMAHLIGVSVEGELGHLGSLETGKGEAEDGHGFEGELTMKQLLTDPDEAVDFVAKTNVDALAIAIGTSHGAYKFSRKPDGDILAMDRLKEIHAKLPNTHLVMHGSSSVPEHLQKIINDNGGEMTQTFGVPLEEIELGIKNGVRKINVDTDLRMALTGAIRKLLNESKSEFDPRKYLAPGIEAMSKVCEERYERFGTAGNAHKIKSTPMDDMAKRYTAGTI